jgi:endo-1,4-beta-D-glucanase Y
MPILMKTDGIKGHIVDAGSAHSSGGAAGGVVSEGQGYGLFFAGAPDPAHSSGAAAGGIVSEGQGYGLFFASATDPAHSSGAAAGGVVSEGQGYGIFMTGDAAHPLFTFDLI